MRKSRRAFLASGAALGAWPLVHAWPQDPKPRQWRACVIGNTKRGGYGHGLDVCFQRLPNVTVVAVADPDEAGRLAAAKRAGAERTYADWAEMLQKEKPDLVANGPRFVEKRLEVFRACAAVGASVYSEKPMAGSLEEADAILAACDQAGVKTQFAHQVRPAPQIEQARKALADGLIGDLLEIRTRGKEDKRSGGEDLMVLGTHCMYLMRLFGGDPLWCSARVTVDGREITREDRRAASEPLGPVAGDSIHATYGLPKGVVGFFDSRKQPRPGGRFGVVLVGNQGSIHCGPGDLSSVTWRKNDRDPGQPLPGAPSNDDPSGLTGPAAANKRLVEDLMRAVESKSEPMASGRECRAALELIHATYAAHLSGGRIALPLKDRSHPLGSL